MKPRPRVLVIGGSDPGGRAGVLRDVEALHVFDVDIACAITAVTAQTDAEVLDVQLVEPAMLQRQVLAAFASGPVDAVKIGMLGSAANAAVLAEMMAADSWPPVVLDPVLAASSGGSLLEAAAHAVLCKQLLPRVTLVTPNLPEAAWLLNEHQAEGDAALLRQALRLHELGARNVLLKGGHIDGAVARDVLLTEADEVVVLDAPRVEATMRGTGCALASAIAAGLARGQGVVDACREAKTYVHNCLQLGPRC